MIIRFSNVIGDPDKASLGEGEQKPVWNDRRENQNREVGDSINKSGGFVSLAYVNPVIGVNSGDK